MGDKHNNKDIKDIKIIARYSNNLSVDTELHDHLSGIQVSINQD